MEIVIKAKQVYGETKFYPECNNSRLFALIAGTKTLTIETLQHIKSLGYKVVVKVDEIKV